MSTIHDDADFTPARQTFTELRPFRAWVQKVLPLVYDDSLSYYELLSKVLDGLNKMIEDLNALGEDTTALYSAFEQLQQFVNDYFNGLDVEKSLEDLLDKLITTGEFNQMFVDATTQVASEWFDDHLTGSEWVIDDSLSIGDAAADAKAVGDRLKMVYDLNGANAVLLENGTDLDSINIVGNYVASPSEVAASLGHRPSDYPGRLIVTRNTTGSRRIQFYITNSKIVHIYARYYTDNTWNDWQEIGNEGAFILNGSDAKKIGAFKDLNTFTEPGNYRVATASDAAGMKNIPFTAAGGRLTVMSNNQSDNIVQIYTVNSASFPRVYFRYGSAADPEFTFSDWSSFYTRRPEQQNIRLLLVGNSYSYHCAHYIARYLYDLGYNAIVGVWYYGASRLAQQYEALNSDVYNSDTNTWSGSVTNNYYEYNNSVNAAVTEDICFTNAIQMQPWNVIVFQQASVVAGQYSSYVNDSFDINNLRDLILSRLTTTSAVRWGVMLPWSYAEGYQSEDFETLYDSDPKKQLAANIATVPRVCDHMGNAFIVNVGLAVDKARQNPYLSQIGVQLCREENNGEPDLSHLDTGIPRMMAGMVFAATITGESPYRFSYVPSSGTFTTTPTIFLAYLAQICTEYALDYIQVTTDSQGTEDERITALETAVTAQQTQLDGKVDLSGATMGGQLFERNYDYGADDGNDGTITTTRLAVGSSPVDGTRVAYIGSSTIRATDNTPMIVVHGQYRETGTDGDAMTLVSNKILSTMCYAGMLDSESIEAADQSAIDLINLIPVKQFDMKNGVHYEFGLVGDDLNSTLLGDYNARAGVDGVYAINTLYLVAVLIKAVQELYAELHPGT